MLTARRVGRRCPETLETRRVAPDGDPLWSSLAPPGPSPTLGEVRTGRVLWKGRPVGRRELCWPRRRAESVLSPHVLATCPCSSPRQFSREPGPCLGGGEPFINVSRLRPSEGLGTCSQAQMGWFSLRTRPGRQPPDLAIPGAWRWRVRQA